MGSSERASSPHGNRSPRCHQSASGKRNQAPLTVHPSSREDATPKVEAATDVAIAACEFTWQQRDALATARTAGDLGSLLGMWP